MPRNKPTTSKTAQAAAAVLDAPAPAPATPGLPATVLDRLGVERRVLGFITDEVDKTALGPRNTLHALTFGLMHDENTTQAPPETHGRLEVEGKSVEEIAQSVLAILDGLIEQGLAAVREDGSYERTQAGEAELAS